MEVFCWNFGCMGENVKRNIYKDFISNTDSATYDLHRQKEFIHADVRQQAVVVEEEIHQVAGFKALLLFM